MNNHNQLTPQQQSLVTLAAYEATGDTTRLQQAVRNAFNNGLTVNQIKEVFSHLYAYTGFPRSLNAQTVLQTVIADREQNALPTPLGEETSPLPADYNALQQGTQVQTQLCGTFTYTFCPAEDYYLKAHLFGDIFVRDLLTYEQRELVTVSALAACYARNTAATLSTQTYCTDGRTLRRSRRAGSCTSSTTRQSKPTNIPAGTTKHGICPVFYRTVIPCTASRRRPTNK